MYACGACSVLVCLGSVIFGGELLGWGPKSSLGCSFGCDAWRVRACFGLPQEKKNEKKNQLRDFSRGFSHPRENWAACSGARLA
jgi:hypothetical protein